MKGEVGVRARGRAVGRSDTGMRRGGGEKGEAKCANDLEEAYSRQTTITRKKRVQRNSKKTNDTHWQTNVKQLLVKHVWMQHTGVFSVSLL